MIGYTETSEGNKSATRLIFIIGSVWNMIIVSIMILKSFDLSNCIAFFSSIEIILVGLKLGQKPMEKHGNESKLNNNELLKD